jgi:hypothetical protein
MGEDIKAKLLGYIAELANVVGRKLDERADAIRGEIKALEGPARAEVERLRTTADGHQALNQDDLAAARRGEADELEALLPAKDGDAPEGDDTAVDEDPPVTRDVDGDGVDEVLPRKSASTEVWRQFAVEHGMSEDDANAKSRDELVAYFAQDDDQVSTTGEGN